MWKYIWNDNKITQSIIIIASLDKNKELKCVDEILRTKFQRRTNDFEDQL